MSPSTVLFIPHAKRLLELPPILKPAKKIWKELRSKAAQPKREKGKRKPNSNNQDHQSLPQKRYRASPSAPSKRADGTAATGKGLRVKRIGEASNPGPRTYDSCQSHGLKIWGCNVFSWHKHGRALLDSAVQNDVHIICVQETNLGQHSKAACQRLGWYMIHTAALPFKGRGWVAILTREPFAAKKILSLSTPEGQILIAEVFNNQRKFTVGTAYRKPGADWTFLQKWSQHLALEPHQDWIFSMDTNCNVESSPIGQFFTQNGGSLRAVAQHDRSSCKIDGIWTSSSLQPLPNLTELPGPSDHSIAQAYLEVYFQKGPPIHRFARVAEPPSLDTSNVPQNLWPSLATTSDQWHIALHSVDDAWNCWCGDVARWCDQAFGPATKPPERELGSQPHVAHSTSRVAPMQSIQERQVRRHLTKFHAWKGTSVPPKLMRHLMSPIVPPHERSLIFRHHWGPAIQAAKARLDAVLAQSKSEALSKWRDQIHTLPGACKWLRQENPVSFALRDHENRVVTSRSRGVACLRDFWKGVFGTKESACNPETFIHHFADFIPSPQPAPELSPITSKSILKELGTMQRKASGLDGFSARLLASLPDAAVHRLAEFLACCEQQGQWPSSLTHWKVVCIPKVKGENLCGVDETRPISVAPIIYRIWAKIRMRELAPWCSQFLHPCQAGGLHGQDAETLTLCMDLLCPADDFPFCCSLDYSKAFDSVDFSICVALFRKIGLNIQICNLLQHQWTNHKRWITFGGAVAPHPLDGCLGLPQGDPWSPFALALTLAPKQLTSPFLDVATSFTWMTAPF